MVGNKDDNNDSSADCNGQVYDNGGNCCPMEFAWIKFLETRGKGKFDRKRTGTEMTNGKGMNCLQNFTQVTTAMMAMYEPNSMEHQWLWGKVHKWDALAEALFEVHCFFKSQSKRDPGECDDKLYALWCAWQDVYPGLKFNKFHGAFCVSREFVHK